MTLFRSPFSPLPLFLLLLLAPCLSAQRVTGNITEAGSGTGTDARGYGERGGLIGFYQRVLSPARGDVHCPMHPSCSEYAARAFDRLPWYEATVRTMDRLLRCGNDLGRYPRVSVDGQTRWLDPLPDEAPPAVATHTVDAENVQPPVLALPPGDPPPDTAFAAFLYSLGEYERAATEYFHLLFAAGEEETRAHFALRIAECRFAAGEYQRCLDDRLRFADLVRPSRPARERMFLLSARSALRLARWQEAADFLQWSGIGPGSGVRREQQRLLGIVFARMGKFEEAEEAWGTAGRDENDTVSAALLRGIPFLQDAPRRSPLLAGMLSAVVPGAGYAYAGRPATALAALIINGLFAWATYDAGRSQQYGLAAAVGFFGLGWYTAGISGSASAAAAYGEASRADRLDRLLVRWGLERLEQQSR